MLIAALGLSGLLASCGGDLGTVNNSSPVTITNIGSFTSDWYYMDGTTKKYVICRDKTTTVEFNVSWTGPLARLDATFKGGSTGATVTKSTGYFTPDFSGNDVFTYTFDAGMAPQSFGKGEAAAKLKAQSIIVTPKNPATTSLTVQGFNQDGNPSNSFPAVLPLEVVTCG